MLSSRLCLWMPALPVYTSWEEKLEGNFRERWRVPWWWNALRDVKKGKSTRDPLQCLAFSCLLCHPHLKPLVVVVVLAEPVCNSTKSTAACLPQDNQEIVSVLLNWICSKSWLFRPKRPLSWRSDMGFALGHSFLRKRNLPSPLPKCRSDDVWYYSDQQNLRISGCVLNSARHLTALHYICTQQITKRIPGDPAFTLVVSPQRSLPFRSWKKEELAAISAEARSIVSPQIPRTWYGAPSSCLTWIYRTNSNKDLNITFWRNMIAL
jgi:hypothetical protein